MKHFILASSGDFSILQWKSKLTSNENTINIYTDLPDEQSPLQQCLLHSGITLPQASSPPLKCEASSGCQLTIIFFQHPFLFSNAVRYVTLKAKQARAPWLIMLCPTGSWHLFTWKTTRYWLWLGKLGPAGWVTQQLYLCQDNSCAPHYSWCIIDFTAIKSWRFQAWLKCQISIKATTKKKSQTFTKWMLPGDALATLLPSPAFWSPVPMNIKLKSASCSPKMSSKMAAKH